MLQPAGFTLAEVMLNLNVSQDVEFTVNVGVD